MKKEEACLEDKDGIAHDLQDLSHRTPLIAMEQGTVVFIGNHPPQIPDKIALHIDNKNEQQQAQQEEKDLEAPRRGFS